MNTCPNCGKMAGLHGSILQGCMCQYSMQAPTQRTWVGLPESAFAGMTLQQVTAMKYAEQILKDQNT